MHTNLIQRPLYAFTFLAIYARMGGHAHGKMPCARPDRTGSSVHLRDLLGEKIRSGGNSADREGVFNPIFICAIHVFVSVLLSCSLLQFAALISLHKLFTKSFSIPTCGSRFYGIKQIWTIP
jgi:hypothetical protein